MGGFLAAFDDDCEEACFPNRIGAAPDSTKLDWREVMFLAGLYIGTILAVGEEPGLALSYPSFWL